MKITSEIATYANTLVKKGYDRSSATKKAFAKFNPKLVEFRKTLNGNGGRVLTVRYRANKHGGDIQVRDAIAVSAAIQKGLYTPKDGQPSPDHVVTYFDLAKGEVRRFIDTNFVSFE
jgi:hypothetical protein